MGKVGRRNGRLPTLVVSALLAASQACTNQSYCPAGTREDPAGDRCTPLVDPAFAAAESDASNPVEMGPKLPDAPSPVTLPVDATRPDGQPISDAGTPGSGPPDAMRDLTNDTDRPTLDPAAPGAGSVEVQLAASAPGKVTLRLVNSSKNAVRVAGWRPSSTEQLLSVLRGGEAVAYVGAVVARVADPAHASWALGPNESLTQEVDVAADFDLGQGGVFEVRPSPRSALVLLSSNVPLSLESRLVLTIGADVAAAKRPPATQPANRWEGCNNDQRAALSAAGTGLNALTAHLDQEWANDVALRRSWFGTLSSGDDLSMTTDVLTPIRQIRALTTSETSSFACAPSTGPCADPSTYAYVSGADIAAHVPRVQLCPLYWLFPLDVGDADAGVSRVGGLAHAYTLFFVDPSDHTFGERACRELATENPSQARRNPDNFRLYIMGRP